MKPHVIIICIVVVVAISIWSALTSASDCHTGVVSPKPTKERMIYRADGSTERCRVASNGVEYCR